MNNLPDPDLVVFKNVLHKNKTENDIINIVLKKLASLNEDLKKYKFCCEMALYICNLVEHLVAENRFDKKKIVITIISSIFNLNLNEVSVYDNMIEFLHSNQLIEKVGKKVDDFFLYKLNAIFPKKNLLDYRQKMFECFKTWNNKYN